LSAGVSRLSVVFFAFAFAVIADPSHPWCTQIEAALRTLHGGLALLLPTMSLVVGLVVVVTANYWQLLRRFPKGGGAAAAAGRALGPRWTILSIGSLTIDFVLTIGISIDALAAAAAAFTLGVNLLRGWPMLSLPTAGDFESDNVTGCRAGRFAERRLRDPARWTGSGAGRRRR
jgi:amino acid transporter